MKLISLLTIAALAGTMPLFAAEKYESSGFSAEIGGSGVIRNLKFAGMPLATSIGINGQYELPPGTEKYDSRFFQAWDYSNKAQFKREGAKLTVTVDSTFSNTKLKDAAAYKMVCVLEPEKIKISCEVTQKTALQTTLRLFFEPYPDAAFPVRTRGESSYPEQSGGIQSPAGNLQPEIPSGRQELQPVHGKRDPDPERRKRCNVRFYGLADVGRKRFLADRQSIREMDSETGHSSGGNRLEMGLHPDLSAGIIKNVLFPGPACAGLFSGIICNFKIFHYITAQ